MNIDFNNVRAQACFAYDRLVKALNASTEYEGNLLVDPNSIEKPLNDLRMMIGSIAMTYEPGDEKFKDVYSEKYTKEGKKLAEFEFNEDEE